MTFLLELHYETSFFFFFFLQVNVWAFHDPYAMLEEDKPLKPGNYGDRVACFSIQSAGAYRVLCLLQGSATEFPTGWTTAGRGKGNEPLSFGTSGAGSEEPVRTNCLEHSCSSCGPIIC